jgi:hypothetical protein
MATWNFSGSWVAKILADRVFVMLATGYQRFRV